MDSVSGRHIDRPAETDGNNSAAERTIPRKEHERPARRVLVLEPDTLLRWAITETLRSSGHAVIEASDGVAAEGALRLVSGRIDVVLLAHDFPASPAFDVLAALHGVAPGRTVLMTTPDGARLWKAGALAPGSRACLVKPFEMARLEGVVLNVCA